VGLEWREGLSKLAASFSVSRSSLSNRLAPGSTRGAGYSMMLSEVLMSLVEEMRHL
jgi:hypothetical protein